MKQWTLPTILAAAVVAVALTGCTVLPSDHDSHSAHRVAVASYPTQFLVQLIAGEDLEVLVLGRPGVSLHDYEPTLQDLQRLRSADLLVLHGFGLEPWVEQALNSLGASAPQVVRVAGVPAGESLLEADHVHDHGGGHHGHDHDDHGHDGHGHDHDGHGHDHHGHDHDGHGGGQSVHVSELEVVLRATGEAVADLHGDHWHGSRPEIHLGSHVSLEAVFLDEDGHHIHLGHDEEYQFMARLAHGAAEGVVEVVGHGDHLHLRGLQAGSVDVVFQLWHEGHAEWEAPAILARVVDDDDDHHDGHNDGHHDDRHGGHHDDHHDGHHDDHHDGHHDDHHGDHHGGIADDPHTWLDPLSYAAQARNVAAALGEAYPELADAFPERADAVVERLHELHHDFEEGLAQCVRHTIATNHNAYAYLARRYQFDVQALHDIEPGFQPSPAVVDRVLRTIKDQGLPVLFLEEGTSPQVVRSIERETGVELMVLNTLEVPPASGDYFTAMEENLERLRYALGCD